MVAENNSKTTEESKYNKDVYINFHLKGKTKRMFIDLKEYYNTTYNMELFNIIVKKHFDEIFKKI